MSSIDYMSSGQALFCWFVCAKSSRNWQAIVMVPVAENGRTQYWNILKLRKQMKYVCLLYVYSYKQKRVSA